MRHTGAVRYTDYYKITGPVAHGFGIAALRYIIYHWIPAYAGMTAY